MTGCGIYKIHWDSTDLFYIGQSCNLKARKQSHTYSFVRNYAPENLLLAYEKYGMPTFSVIEYCERDCLKEREDYYLKSFLNNTKCLNKVKRGVKVSTYVIGITVSEDECTLFEILIKDGYTRREAIIICMQNTISHHATN